MIDGFTSISRVLQLVEQAISKSPNTSGVLSGPTQAMAQSQNASDQPLVHAQQSVQFPSLLDGTSEHASNNFIRLSDRHTQSRSYEGPLHQSDDPLDAAIATLDPMSSLDFDVLTTDLFNFFPTSLENATPAPGMNQPQHINTSP